GGGWAVPGGSIEAGEDGQAAAVRELEEETCLAVPLESARAGLPRHVPDPRASDEAWAVTVPCEVDLGDVGELPPVKGRDDARRAAWLAAPDYDDLLDSLITGYASTGTATVFTAHQQMLRAFLGGLPAIRHDDGPPVVIHEIGWLWRWVNRLGLAVPRSLCGQPQLAAPGQPRPGPGSPQCPACTAALAIRSRS
ncbi:MAG TPA: NUDIX domain-containing protein, partial [Trebonia sp.]|nr:NUDIX domain-containing protein [Trebonia sp.]